MRKQAPVWALSFWRVTRAGRRATRPLLLRPARGALVSACGQHGALLATLPRGQRLQESNAPFFGAIFDTGGLCAASRHGYDGAYPLLTLVCSTARKRCALRCVSEI